MIPDPWFDYDPFIALGSALEKLLDSWGNLLVDQVIQVPEVVLVVRQGSQMKVGMKCNDLASSNNYWLAFMEKDQMRSSRWFRKILEICVQKGRQEDISKMSGVARGNFRSGRKVIPQQCDKPLGQKIFLPLITDYSFIDCISRFCSGINPFKLSIEFSRRTLSVPSLRE